MSQPHRAALVSLAPTDLLPTAFPDVRWGEPLKHTDVKSKTQHPKPKSKMAQK